MGGFVSVEKDKCFACNGLCNTVCLGNYITVNEEHAVIREACCIGCGKCILVCPAGAIRRIK